MILQLIGYLAGAAVVGFAIVFLLLADGGYEND